MLRGIGYRLSRNSSDIKIFKEIKVEYKKALNMWGDKGKLISKNVEPLEKTRKRKKKS